MKLSIRLSVFVVFLLSTVVSGQQVELKDGRIIPGKFTQIDSVATGGGEDLSTRVRNIIIVDDNLRRIFVPRRQVMDIISSTPAEALETFKIPQRNLDASHRMNKFRTYEVVEDFDDFGRRIVQIDGKYYVQGITEITPHHVRIQGQNVNWDMRIATTNLPRETITRILMKQIAPKDLEARKRLVRFYMQGERDRDAREELDSILKDFADDKSIVQQMAGVKNALLQSEARMLLKELELRHAAGQVQLVQTLLKNFPLENVSAEIIQRVRNLIRQDDEKEQRQITLLAKLEPLIATIVDENTRKSAQEVFDEIKAELDINTLNRLDAFFAIADDPDTGNDEKLALALSGWFLGSNDAIQSLPTTLSIMKTRDLVVQYLIKKDTQHREQIFQEIEEQEAGKIEIVAKLIPQLKPPYPLNAKANSEYPGYFVVETPSFENQTPFQYCVQLPPEYNPNRRYPMIMTLHGINTTPDDQIDWWAGPWRDTTRFGQAARHGYIVIAPSWNPEEIYPYDYSAISQAAVLYCYYDALRHFAVDTDRVFLSGFGEGGTAAWDIGLAHPDLWAGVIPICGFDDAVSYINGSQPNAKEVPTYFVGGELDINSWLIGNRRNFDWYLTKGYPSTVVQFRGRGQESFSDEILRLFEWMKIYRREFPKKHFEVQSMRPWDNAFWWVEVEEFTSSSMVDPFDWPVKGTRPAKITADVTSGNNGLRINSIQLLRTSIWLSPELINFDLRTEITVNNRKIPLSGGFAEPNLRHLLDDVRTRHDRQHPFWLRLDFPPKK